MSAVEKTAVLDRLTGTRYLSAHSTYPDDAGSGEVPGTIWTDYGRLAFDADAILTAPAASGEAHFVENSSKLSYPAATTTEDTLVLKGRGIWTAESGGDFIYGSPLWSDVASFVALATDDTFYSPGHPFLDDQKVVLLGSSLPGAVAEETEYFVINAATNSFQLSTSEGGSAIDITADGAGNAGVSEFITVVDGQVPTIPVQNLQVMLS